MQHVICSKHTTLRSTNPNNFVGDQAVEGMILFVPYEAVYKLGLAIEGGCDEATQRRCWGDTTVDLVIEANRDAEFLNWYERTYAPAQQG